MPEIDLGVDSCLLWCIQKLGNEWKWVSVFLGNSVEALKVDARSKRAVFLLNKKDQCSMRRVRGMD